MKYEGSIHNLLESLLDVANRPAHENPALVEREESTAHANVVSFNVAMLQEAMTRLNSCSCMLQSPAREKRASIG